MFKHKNWLAGLLAVVMLFSLTACGGSKQEASTGDNSQTEQPAEAPAESDLSGAPASTTLTKPTRNCISRPWRRVPP